MAMTAHDPCSAGTAVPSSTSSPALDIWSPTLFTNRATHSPARGDGRTAQMATVPFASAAATSDSGSMNATQVMAGT